jgi:hypothetical protein
MIRLENATVIDLSADDPTIPRITADFLPLRSPRKLLYDLHVPTKLKDNFVQRVLVQFAEPDLIRATPIAAGIIPGATLFAEPPLKTKWTKDLTKLKTPPPPAVTQFRETPDGIETLDVPPPPAKPGQWWDPILKFRMKRGDSWSSVMPGGRSVTYTVMAFGKDHAGRETLELQRLVKNPQVAMFSEETTITYVRSIGQVRRVVVTRADAGPAVVTSELKYVEPDDLVIELKKEPDAKKSDPKE